MMKFKLKHDGRIIEIKHEGGVTNEINILGWYSPSNYNAASIVDKNGCAPTVMENHGRVTSVVVEDER